MSLMELEESMEQTLNLIRRWIQIISKIPVKVRWATLLKKERAQYALWTGQQEKGVTPNMAVFQIKMHHQLITLKMAYSWISHSKSLRSSIEALLIDRCL